MMDEEVRKEAIWDLHEWRLKTMRYVQETIWAINWQRRQIELDDMFIARKEQDEYLLRVYLQLRETEEECSRLISRQQGQEEFIMLVRAALAARKKMEELEQERRKNGGFLKGIADAIDMRNARERVRTNSDSGPGGP